MNSIEEKENLIIKLHEHLKHAETGDDIRAVFFTMFNYRFTEEEIKEVLKEIHITDEKIKDIEKQEEMLQR